MATKPAGIIISASGEWKIPEFVFQSRSVEMALMWMGYYHTLQLLKVSITEKLQNLKLEEEF